MEKILVGDLRLGELSSRLLLMRNTKIRDCDFKFVGGFMKTKVLCKKGGTHLRYRNLLDIDEVENMSIKEFHDFLIDRCEKYGDERYKK